MKKAPRGIFLLIALCILSNAAQAQQHAPNVVTDLAYISPARLVDIGSGRKMNLFCIGHGSPTVIFESGLGDQIRAWALVQPAIAETTRACAYDRAGLGFSSASGRAGTSAHAVEDLHKLLRAASIKPPYILVGHSLGGMYVRLYADKYFPEIAGMVLVDPVSEEQGRRYHALDSTTLTADDNFVKYLHDQCMPAAARGFEQGSELMKKCVGAPDSRFSDAFNTAFLANHSTPRYMEAAWSEWANVFSLSSDQVRAAKRDYDKLPLIVLTRIPQPKGPQEMRDAKVRLWNDLHDDLAHLSTRGVNRVIPDSGHYIQFDKPDVVIGAIREVLQTAAGAR